MTTSHTPTIIDVQGEPQEVIEVYTDESREQTLGFVYDERIAKILPQAINSYEAMKEALTAALRVFHIDSDMEEDFAPEIKQIRHALTLAEGKDTAP